MGVSKGKIDSMCVNSGHFWVFIASNGGAFWPSFECCGPVQQGPSGTRPKVPLLFASEEAVFMNTTAGHTKMNKAVTK